MKDNCIANDVKADDSKAQPKVLIVDPEGNLKSVKWRLERDGFGVVYTAEAAEVKALIRQSDVRIVMVNVSNSRDLNNITTINSIKGSFRVIAFTAGYNIELKKKMFALGVKKAFSRPIDFPGLSYMVREELNRPVQDLVFENATADEGHGMVPLNVTSACKTVLDRVRTAVMITDCLGEIICVNRPMIQLLQMNEANISNRNYEKVMDEIPGTYQHELLKVLHNTIKTMEPQSNLEIVVTSGNGNVMPVDTEAYPLFDSKGKFSGAFLTVGEMPGSGKFERFAAQSEKLAVVGQLAAGAVHEIKNPLTSVKGFIQLLQNEANGSPKAEYYNIIIDEIDRVNNIVNDFLRLAKPAKPNRRPYDLRGLWKDIRVLTESKAFLLDINIKEDFPEHIRPVLIDSEQIKQVVINVVINSFEAMADGGNLTVRIYEIKHENALCMEISDTGTGMDEETARRIFVPFFTTKEDGTGLGLAVSAAIMENHGGHMEVKSRLGEGTTTLLYFLYE